jgi:hypothetical protein
MSSPQKKILNFSPDLATGKKGEQERASFSAAERDRKLRRQSSRARRLLRRHVGVPLLPAVARRTRRRRLPHLPPHHRPRPRRRRTGAGVIKRRFLCVTDATDK